MLDLCCTWKSCPRPACAESALLNWYVPGKNGRGPPVETRVFRGLAATLPRAPALGFFGRLALGFFGRLAVVREVGDLLPAGILVAIATPLHKNLVPLSVQHPPWGVLTGRWIVQGIGIGGAELVFDGLPVLDQDPLQLLRSVQPRLRLVRSVDWCHSVPRGPFDFRVAFDLCDLVQAF